MQTCFTYYVSYIIDYVLYSQIYNMYACPCSQATVCLFRFEGKVASHWHPCTHSRACRHLEVEVRCHTLVQKRIRKRREAHNLTTPKSGYTRVLWRFRDSSLGFDMCSGLYVVTDIRKGLNLRSAGSLSCAGNGLTDYPYLHPYIYNIQYMIYIICYTLCYT